jgi:predicted pyridoxine 5'-phosphate oxidase superfamily flavin-nucleotide-binding protein
MAAPLLERRPWLDSEIAARRLAGAPEIGPVIRTFLTDQHRDFFGRLPLVFVAGIDTARHPVASILRGAPGFIQSPDPKRLEIAAAFPDGETLSRAPSAPLGMIGVDFAARRRNRVNGRIVAADAGGLSLAVDEAFGNCPKYIAPQADFAGAGPGRWEAMPGLDSAARALIESAETFFIATRGPDGVDMSHRGGPPGFARIGDDGALAVPDFPGNNYFNTFGNLLHDPRAALLFPDFQRGCSLHLAGEARLHMDSRRWTFAPRAARRLDA